MVSLLMLFRWRMLGTTSGVVLLQLVLKLSTCLTTKAGMVTVMKRSRWSHYSDQGTVIRPGSSLVDPVNAVHPEKLPQQVKVLYQRSLLPPLTTAPIVPGTTIAPAGLFPVFPPVAKSPPQEEVRSKFLDFRWMPASKPPA